MDVSTNKMESNTIFEFMSFEDIDFLLQRDWFLDDEGIIELLWRADQATYDRLVENRKAYSKRVRFQLCPMDEAPKIPAGGVPARNKVWKSLKLSPESSFAQSSSSPSPSQTGSGSS